MRITDPELVFRSRLTSELDSFLSAAHGRLARISPEAAEPVTAIAALATGGKRMRALLCYWGYRGAGGAAEAEEIVKAGAALELFQTAALIHDDVIDRSDTRRGAPSIHRRFADLHVQSGWHLDADRFGEAAAILTGDLALSFSEELFASVAGADHASRKIFNTMRSEVMAGQYLDILEEAVGPGFHPETAIERACNVLRYKSAKYSSEHPLGIGGALAGASADLLLAYSDFSLPLGEAFQLRDDVLGVYGDPAVTGKPAGDDLREGKRTVLIAYALAGGTTADAAEISRRLGDSTLDADGVALLRGIIESSGALAATEALIAKLSGASLQSLAALPVEDDVKAGLRRITHAAITRSA